MQKPLRVTFRHMDPSPALEERVREHLDRLERFHDEIIHCSVVVDAPPGHSQKGAPFEIKIDLSVPGKEISVRSDGARRESHTDAYVALRDAFENAKRVLQDFELARRERLQA
jgi:ribosomal subunit interface protein